MATKLDKDIIRESTVQIDGREINVTLGADQQIKMKLKGMKTGEVTIDIGKLYKQLTGLENALEEDSDSEDDEPETKGMVITHHDDDERTSKGKIMIDLYDLRSANIINGFDVPTMAKFDGIIADLIKQKEEILAAQKTLAKGAAKAKKKK